MALIEDASYATAGSNVVISDIPASGVIYTCLLGGAFTGVAGWLLPPNRSQAVKSMVIKQSRSIVYFLPGYIFDDSLISPYKCNDTHTPPWATTRVLSPTDL